MGSKVRTGSFQFLKVAELGRTLWEERAEASSAPVPLVTGVVWGKGHLCCISDEIICGGEDLFGYEKLWCFVVIAAYLINSQCNRLVLVSVLAFDH